MGQYNKKKFETILAFVKFLRHLLNHSTIFSEMIARQ